MKFVTGVMVGIAIGDVWAGGAAWAGLWALEYIAHRVVANAPRPEPAKAPWPAEENVS